MKRHFLASALLLFPLAALAQTGAAPLLAATAEKYRTIGSFQGTAVAERQIENGIRLRIPMVFFYLSPRMTPQDFPASMIAQGQFVQPVQAIDRSGRQVNASGYSRGFAQGQIPNFSEIDLGIESARLLGKETVTGHNCRIVEAVYDSSQPGSSAPHGTLRYWIEPASKTIWRMQLLQSVRPGLRTSEATWTIDWDKWEEDKALPGWLMDASRTALAAKERTDLIGKHAPDVRGIYLNQTGRFDLVAQQGHIVVIDFWATWCGPCAEEMRELDRLRNASSGVVFVGVTEGAATPARRWLDQRGQKLPAVLTETGTAFAAYGIRELPALVLVDRDGIVVHQWIGLKNIRELKTEIDALLARSAAP